MLLYGCLYIGVSGPLVFENVQEIQPWGRITINTSQSHNELSTNVRWGCGPEQLAATVPCARVYIAPCNGEAHASFGRVL